MTLLLTHSTEIQLPELPRPITDYAWFELRRRDARWCIFGRLAAPVNRANLVASYFPETEAHIARAVYLKLDALHSLTCALMGVRPWSMG